ncbi:MAG: ABC transporter substrate-binding protein, partial [Actinomycetota bacterium]|nr:ABC transporter substrate-binding protein [Actinomycetota bacterium]
MPVGPMCRDFARRTPLPLAAVVAVALTAAGCSSITPAADGGATTAAGGSGGSGGDSFGTPANASEVSNGGTLVMALSAEPDKLDPALSRSLYSRYVFNAMCEKLYDVDQSAKIVPQLASALPTTSSDGKTVTIPVREGVKFADGTPFDATAVKATFDRNLTQSGTARKSELGPIDTVEATDAKTVVVHLKQPFAPLTAALTDRA